MANIKQHQGATKFAFKERYEQMLLECQVKDEKIRALASQLHVTEDVRDHNQRIAHSRFLGLLDMRRIEMHLRYEVRMHSKNARMWRKLAIVFIAFTAVLAVFIMIAIFTY